MQSVIDYLLTANGRVAVGLCLYGLIALVKLIPWVKANATPAAKVISAVLVGLAAGATSWMRGESVWVGLATLASVTGVAIGAHEVISRAVVALAPLLKLLPGVGPAIAAALVFVFSPSSSPKKIDAPS